MNIVTAKFRLYNKSPFWGSIIFNLPVIEDEKIGTLGVDGESLFVNPKFWDSLTDAQQLGVLCHEIGHLFLGHIWRRGHRDDICVDPKTGQMVSLWNLAADVTVNNMIINENRFTLPIHAFVKRELDNKSTEEIYEILKKQIPKMSEKEIEQLMESIYNNKDKWNKKGKTRKEAKEEEAKWKNIGKQAMENAKAQGKIPAGLERTFKELEPKEDWRQILLSYVQPFSNDYSFNPTDRRFLEDDFALPDIQQGEKIDWIAIGIDTSGSIGTKELDSFMSEVKSILSAYDKVKVKITFCDAEASPFTELEEFDASKLKVTGGGGTDFRPVFDLIKKEDNEPVALIYFTDMMGTFPGKSPQYDVLWISTSGDEKAPFGKCLPYAI